MNESARSTVRLAELVATLSLGTDLGLGQPMEHVILQTLIALRMSERLLSRAPLECEVFADRECVSLHG